MTPAFEVKEFLTLSENTASKSNVISKIHKVSTKTQFVTKFCCRQDNLKELLSFHNIASRAISNSNSYTKIIGLAGEGGIGKSRLVSEFAQKISADNSKNVIKINYSDKNNLVFQNEIEGIRNILESKIRSINKSRLPAVVILEDIHWYEAEEKKKVEKLLFAFSGELPIPFCLSVIFMITNRITKTEYNFQKFDSFEDMQLMPLSESQSNEFITHSSLIDKNKISKSLKEKIISLSAGIPFYIEEFLKSMTIDNGKEKIPDSIELLLSYKLSFIHYEVLKVLQIIATWDGGINKELLINICQKLRVIFQTEKSLLQTGIIRVESKNGEVNYSFTHDIYKNYIAVKTENYFGILIHKTIAGIFEKYTVKTEHTLFKLYYHFKNSNEQEKAYEYLEYYINKIVEQREYETALHRIDELMEYYSKDEKKKLEIWLVKIKCLRELLKRDEMGKELRRIVKPIYKAKRSENELEYLYQMEEFYFLSNDFSNAYRFIYKGLKLSKQIVNLKYQVKFQFLLVRNLNTNGKISECLKEAEVLSNTSEKIGHKNYFIWAKFFLASNYQKLQNFETAQTIINQSIAQLNNLNQQYLLKNFINLRATFYYQKADFEKFIENLRELYIIERSLNSVHSSVITLLNLADCLIIIRETHEATEILNKIKFFAQKNNSDLFLKRVMEGYMNLYLSNDLYCEAEKVGIKLQKLYSKKDYRNLSILYSNLIIIYSSLEDLKKCYACYIHSLDCAIKMNNNYDKIISHYNMGYAFYLSGNIKESEYYIKKAYNLMNKCFGKDLNFEINFTLAEVCLVKGELKQSLRILTKIGDYFINTKNIEYKIYYEIFTKLLINSNNQKKFEEFIYSKNFLNFFMNSKISNLNKLKVIYMLLLISQMGKIQIKLNFLTQIKKRLNLNYKTKNKIILFYLNQIPH